MGSATLIYVKATSAAEAIKRYNGAQLDDRVMKIEHALPNDSPKVQSPISSGKNLKQRLSVVKKPVSVRRGNNAIQKRDGGRQNNASGNASAKKGAATKRADGGRRGLGQKRAAGKTLNLAPAGSKQRQQQKNKN